ncbi:MAG: hypothetical protein GIKADHBN_00424 [Phycisphaerales bacterium]|nr:hypothetical protein [Phycisphaerales bacterium]
MNAHEFQSELNRRFAEAEAIGVDCLTVTAGDLHRSVGGYPGPSHRMPGCCAVMRANIKPGDKELHSPPKGNGASLEIRYVIPR